MDVSVILRRVENLLRDTLQNVLSNSVGNDWVEKCGVSPDRLEKWRERSTEDLKKRGSCDPRLIYYSDFYDLKTIARKHWNNGLSEILGDLKELEALLRILEELRNPDAHRREFLSFEVQLAQGISGRIQSKIIRHYSQMETSESYYPRFEFAQDSLGSSYSIGQGKTVETKATLRPGDEIHFKLVASDPLGESLEYLIYPNAPSAISRRDQFSWNKSGDFSFQIQDDYVENRFIFVALVRSKREFHAEREHVMGTADDKIVFSYEVLPPRRA